MHSLPIYLDATQAFNPSEVGLARASGPRGCAPAIGGADAALSSIRCAAVGWWLGPSWASPSGPSRYARRSLSAPASSPWPTN